MFLWMREGEELLARLLLLFVLFEEGEEAMEEVEDDDDEEDEDEEEEEDDNEEEEEEVVVGVMITDAVVLVDKLSVAPLLLIRSEMIVLLFTSQLLGEAGGEVEVGDAEAELELATELQLPVFLDKSVGSFSLATAEVWWWW